MHPTVIRPQATVYTQRREMQLKRCHTMKRASEFALVRARGSSEAGRYLVLSTAPLPGSAPASSRFGIITTKRVGHAVQRNLLRRRVREILRAHAEPLASGLYVVVILRRRAVYADYATLERELSGLIKKHQQQNKPSPC